MVEEVVCDVVEGRKGGITWNTERAFGLSMCPGRGVGLLNYIDMQ